MNLKAFKTEEAETPIRDKPVEDESHLLGITCHIVSFAQHHRRGCPNYLSGYTPESNDPAVPTDAVPRTLQKQTQLALAPSALRGYRGDEPGGRLECYWLGQYRSTHGHS